jgi:hypothetical protein
MWLTWHSYIIHMLSYLFFKNDIKTLWMVKVPKMQTFTTNCLKLQGIIFNKVNDNPFNKLALLRPVYRGNILHEQYPNKGCSFTVYVLAISWAIVGQLFACVHFRSGTSKGMCINSCSILISGWTHLSNILVNGCRQRVTARWSQRLFIMRNVYLTLLRYSRCKCGYNHVSFL